MRRGNFTVGSIISLLNSQIYTGSSVAYPMNAVLVQKNPLVIYPLNMTIYLARPFIHYFFTGHEGTFGV